jgi:hypothetical protein
MRSLAQLDPLPSAVISYTNNWMYLAFAALGSWLGAYASMTFLHRAPSHPPPPLGAHG